MVFKSNFIDFGWWLAAWFWGFSVSALALDFWLSSLRPSLTCRGRFSRFSSSEMNSNLARPTYRRTKYRHRIGQTTRSRRHSQQSALGPSSLHSLPALTPPNPSTTDGITEAFGFFGLSRIIMAFILSKGSNRQIVMHFRQIQQNQLYSHPAMNSSAGRNDPIRRHTNSTPQWLKSPSKAKKR